MRQKLTAAIKEAFSFEDYKFYQGFVYNIANTQMQLPCVWLNPADLIGLQGHRDIKGTYKVVLYLFVQAEQFDEDKKAEVWADLEAKAIDAYNKMNLSNNVIELSGLSVSPDEFAYTKFKELSVKVEFKIEVNNCEL